MSISTIELVTATSSAAIAKVAIPASSTRRRPNRSARLPLASANEAKVRLNAFWTHCVPLIEDPRSADRLGSAIAVPVTENGSVALAATTAIRVRANRGSDGAVVRPTAVVVVLVMQTLLEVGENGRQIAALFDPGSAGRRGESAYRSQDMTGPPTNRGFGRYWRGGRSRLRDLPSPPPRRRLTRGRRAPLERRAPGPRTAPR